MKTSDWEKVQEIFDIVSRVPPEDRSQTLLDACEGNDQLRDDVASLLHYHDKSSLFLEDSRLDDGFDVINEKENLKLPECEGPYEIKHQIGQGGMGSVYIAEQMAPIRRKVALKVINSGMNREEFLNRFRYELQVLAMVSHPNIAHVYEAGKTRDRRPFFTMEYVPGKTLIDYCDEEKLSLHQRLELFYRVGNGVAHAHKKGIIHRDLKPSNILVTSIDGKPVPKIIDFGIAKIIDQPGEDHATLFGDLFGTPAYMSPEIMDGSEVDTGADVYALGMVLYELITGKLPFDDEVYFDRSVITLLEDLRVREIPAPSKRAVDAGARAAQARGLSPNQLQRQIRGDLELVILKAVEKDRNHRYQSVDELVEDIRRYLDGYPVEAGKHNLVYYTKKFVRRNSKKLIIAALVFIPIIAFGYGKVGELLALRVAAQGEAKADHTMEFLQAMIEEASPFSHDGKLDPRKLVEGINKKLQYSNMESFPPIYVSELKRSLGRMLLDFGYYKDAKEQLDAALGMYKRAEKKNPISLHLIHILMGQVLLAEGNLEEVAPWFDKVLAELPNPQTKEERSVVLDAMQSKARLYSAIGKHTNAEDLFLEAYEGQVVLLGEEHENTLSTMNNRANNFHKMGDTKRAEEMLRELIALKEKSGKFGPENPSTLRSKKNHAVMMYRLNQLDEALAEMKDVYQDLVRILGDSHPTSISAGNQLHLIQNAMNQNPDEADVAKARELWQDNIETKGENAPATLQAMNNLANTLIAVGRYEEAEAIKRDELARRKRVQGEDHNDTLFSSITLAEIYEARTDYDRAEALYQKIIDGFKSQEHMVNYHLARGFLGGCYHAQEKFDEAESLLVDSYENLKTGSPRFAELIRLKLVDLYNAWGKEDEARKWGSET